MSSHSSTSAEDAPVSMNPKAANPKASKTTFGPETLIGDYRVEGLIGRGGMGAVYLARHLHMDRLVALKVLSSDAAFSSQAALRFEREVKISAKMNHPNLVRAFDASRHNGLLYLTMEYVDGSNFQQLVAFNGPLPLEEAVPLIIQAAQGLSHVHQNGFVHRDIKPANIMLDVSGTVKVLDLGLAKSISSDPAEPTQAHLTQSGRLVGTLGFIAPEQILDSACVDVQADVYSLGCTFYFLLTGFPPFHGASAQEVVKAHQNQPVPFVDLGPAVSPKVNDVLQRMMAKSADDRFSNMKEVIASLEPFRADANSVNLHVVSSLRQELISQSLVLSVLRRTPSNNFRAKVYSLLSAIFQVLAGTVVVIVGIALFALFGIWAKPKLQKMLREPIVAPSQRRAVNKSKEEFQKVCQELRKLNPNWKGTGIRLKYRSQNDVPTDFQVSWKERIPYPENEKGKGVVLPQNGASYRIINGVRISGNIPRRFLLSGHALEIEDEELTRLEPITHIRIDLLYLKSRCPLDLDKLKSLRLEAFACQSTSLTDLKFLRGMPLKYVAVEDCVLVSDLAPLKKAKLRFLNCSNTPVTDLSPLWAQPLDIGVCCRDTEITSLDPLKVSRPFHLDISGCDLVNDLKPLQNQKALKDLYMRRCHGITDLSPLSKLTQLEQLDIRRCRNIKDLTPLRKLSNLKWLWCDTRHLQAFPFLRDMESLVKINDRNAIEVWNELDKK
ncbi:MAG: protein kinase [Gemmataceae bacterium]